MPMVASRPRNSPEDRGEEFKRMLARFDEDNDGSLTLEQLQQAFRVQQPEDGFPIRLRPSFKC